MNHILEKKVDIKKKMNSLKKSLNDDSFWNFRKY